jgi:pimeloyl-ACP methyl ester carboxylesterase
MTDRHVHCGRVSPSVLLLHGQPGSSLVWNRVRPRLEDLGLRVFAVDRPGYGYADAPATDLFGNAEALAGLLDPPGTGPAVVVGHSLGAGVALALAARFPRRVQAMVLLAPAAGLAALSPSDRLLAAPVIGPALSWVGFRSLGLAFQVPRLRRAILRERVGLRDGEAAAVVGRLTTGPLWLSFAIEQRALRSGLRRLETMLAGITAPTMILAGTRDRIVPRRAVTWLAGQLPDAQLRQVDAGHFLPTDAPDAVVEAVLRAVRHHYRTRGHRLGGQLG